ncbi:hypothetical protein B566_EDAN016566 [Ephemera danica]|nr:hypothetical protein B566_EDAN016566 [Ephemera danica]
MFFPSEYGDIYAIDYDYNYLGKENINVIIVDWGELTPKIKCRICMYPRARYATRKVGPYVATMIQYLNEALHISLENFHCVGFSLGAHVCGYTGKSLRSKYDLKLQRITGLDPAGPMYDCYDTSDRLDKTDAIFVDVIHTCTNILGFSLSIGHIDFYPNGGRNQVGCGFDLFAITMDRNLHSDFCLGSFENLPIMHQMLSSNPATLEQPQPNGLLPLHHACKSLHIACVKYLLKSGANAASECPNSGNNAIYFTVFSHFQPKHDPRIVHIINLLLEYRREIETISKQ